MPFCLRNAPATFQRLMDCILGELNEFTNVYIDDISVFSANWDDHLKHLDLVLTSQKRRSNDASSKVTPRHEHLQTPRTCCRKRWYYTTARAVEEFRQPLNKSDVRAYIAFFLGLVGYYRKFIPAFSSTAASLTNLTKKSYPDIVNWTPEYEQSFTKLKQLLFNQPVMRAPDYNIPFTLQTKLKQLLFNQPVLRAPDYNIPFTLQTKLKQLLFNLPVLRAPDYNIPFTLQTKLKQLLFNLPVLRAPDYNIPFTSQY